MQKVSTRVRRSAALLALIALLAVPVLHADNIDPNQPPEAKIKPPIGQAAKIGPPIGVPEILFILWQLAKIAPPIG